MSAAHLRGVTIRFHRTGLVNNYFLPQLDGFILFLKNVQTTSMVSPEERSLRYLCHTILGLFVCFTGHFGIVDEHQTSKAVG